MNDYLIFRLSAALGSMGGYAGNERRGSDQWPARSAINGLIGGALGIDRSDIDAIQQLQTNFRLGIARQALGETLTDFHTAQTIPAAVAKLPSARQHAFAQVKDVKRIMTVLTQREYHQECCFDIAVTSSKAVGLSSDSALSLATIQTALREPRYVPYFGRKACPLDTPMFPVVVSAADVLSAFQQYQTLDAHPNYAKPATDELVAMLDRHLLPKDHPSLDGASVVQLRDQIVDRQHWSFGTGELIRVQQKREHIL